MLAVGASVAAARAQVHDVALDRMRLHFAAVRTRTGGSIQTPAQHVFLELAPATRARPRWSATPTRDWLEVTPASGAAPARLTIAVRPERASAGAREESGRVLVTVRSDASIWQYSVEVTLTLLDVRSAPPTGAFEAPPDGTVIRTRTPLSGWALDDVAVRAIEICAERRPAAGETRCADGSATLIGHARVAAAPRPDVAAAFPSTPMSDRSSWAYVLDQGVIAGRRGTVRLVAIAVDGEHQAARIGARTVTLFPPDTQPRQARGALILAAIGLVFFIVHALARRRVIVAMGTAPAETDGRAPPRRGERLFVAGALAVSLSFNLLGATRGFGYDELYSASHFIVDAPLGRTATDLTVFTNHIFFSLMAAVCTWVLGTAEWVIRLPAAALSTAAVYVAWVFTRRLAGPVAGVAAAYALACSPYWVEWGRAARGYSALGLLTLLSTHLFFVALRTASRRAAVWHAPVTLLALYVHLYGAGVLAIQYATYLLRSVRGRKAPGLRPLWWSFAAIAAGALVLFVPLVDDALVMIAARGRSEWMPGFPLELFRAYAGASAPPIAGWIVLVAAVGLWRLRDRLEAYFVFALIAVPLLTLWAILTPRDLYPRYFSFWAPFFSILVGVGADALAERAGRHLSPGRNRTALRAALVGVVLLPGAAAWIRQDLADVDRGGYRALLTFRDRGAYRIAAAGAEAEMFDYYLGKPLQMFHAPEELDRALREPGRLAVAYHNVPWNRAPHKAVEAMLRRRCIAEETQTVVRFYCDAPSPP